MAHGEYKTPGGKLVVVDFAIRAGRIDDVRVSGDFFLYPESALHAINDALCGTSWPASATQLAERIRQALPAGTEMLGFSPEAIAEAVMRGAAS